MTDDSLKEQTPYTPEVPVLGLVCAVLGAHGLDALAHDLRNALFAHEQKVREPLEAEISRLRKFITDASLIGTALTSTKRDVLNALQPYDAPKETSK